MRWLSTLPLRLRSLFRRDRVEQDLQDELQFHIDALTERHVARGLSPEDARRAAQRETYGLEAVKDWARDTWLPRWLQGLGQDFRLAVRTLRATPAVTFVAVLSLALGVGANTAIFSIADALLLRPLPVTNPERVARLSAPPAVPGMPPGWFSYTTIREFSRYGRELFDGVLGYECCGPAVVTIAGEAQALQRQFVTDDYFTTLGVGPLRGRVLQAGDDDRTSPQGPVAVLSYRGWQGRFGGRDDVIGLPLAIDSVPVTIVGVASPGFNGLQVGHDVDVFIPERWAAALTRTPLNEDTVWLTTIVRLKPGVSTAMATAALRGIQSQIRAGSLPKKPPVSDRWLIGPLTLLPARTGVSDLRDRFTMPLIVLFGVVLVVLLVACANIANLLLARGLARRDELSVRMALGASRWRLLRQLLVESLVLSLAGTGLALGLAVGAGRALIASLSTTKDPILLNVAIDWRVDGFIACLAIATLLLFGLAPALRASRLPPLNALKTQTSGSTRSVTSAHGSLLVAQVALSVLLVFTAGLCVQTLRRLERVPLGFEPDRVLVVTVNTHAIPFAERLSAWQRLVDAASAVPGVISAGGSLDPPIAGVLHTVSANMVVSKPGTAPRSDAEVVPNFESMTPGWLAASGTALLLGRDFDVRDTATSPRVMVVNQAFARRFLPDGNVIGRGLTVTMRTLDDDTLWGVKTVVGVVANSVQGSLRDAPQPMIYVPLAQRADLPTPQSDLYITLRTRPEASPLVTRHVLSALDTVYPNLTFTVAPMSQYVAESLATERVTAVLSGGFGGLALFLAGLGLYGVTSYAVRQRRREIGVRLALGAAPANVIRLVLSRVSLLVGVGVTVGGIISLVLSQLVAAFLYGITPRDPVTLVGAVAILAAVAIVAGWLPAWRASRIDPAAVLREQ